MSELTKFVLMVLATFFAQQMISAWPFASIEGEHEIIKWVMK